MGKEKHLTQLKTQNWTVNFTVKKESTSVLKHKAVLSKNGLCSTVHSTCMRLATLYKRLNNSAFATSS